MDKELYPYIYTVVKLEMLAIDEWWEHSGRLCMALLELQSWRGKNQAMDFVYVYSTYY